MLLFFAVALFLSLASWQWRRAQEKWRLLASYQAGLKAPPLLLNTTPEPVLERFRPVRARGRFDLDHPIWLAYRFFQGRPGYELLLPFELQGRGELILVNLGWTPFPEGDPRKLPSLPPLPEGEVILEGILDRFPALGLYLEGGEQISGWPAVVSWLDLEELERALGRRVLPWQLKLSPEAPFGLKRAWRLALSPPPERHLGYALQWLGFAVVALLLWFSLSWKRT